MHDIYRGLSYRCQAVERGGTGVKMRGGTFYGSQIGEEDIFRDDSSDLLRQLLTSLWDTLEP